MVLIRHENGTWHQPESTAYSSEKELQQIIKSSPSLLPGGVPMAVVDELSIPGVGSVDLLGVTSSGDITIVECKLRANPEIRREVVGQVLAYAGGLWRMTYENFASAFARRATTSLFEAIDALDDEPIHEADFRDAVTRRLEGGEFRLLITVDDITPELKTIVEYLNEHTMTAVSVLALELAYAREGTTELLIPTVYGEESAARRGRTSSGVRWNSNTFAEQVDARTDGAVHAFIERLIEHGSQHGHHPFYGSGTTPGMSYYYDLGGQARSVWALYLEEPVQFIAVSLGIVSQWSTNAAIGLLNDLKKNELLARALSPVSETDLNKYPRIPINPVLTDSAAQKVFFQSLDRLLESGA
jgi:hypothetical protein